jgi:hypothetical protein
VRSPFSRRGGSTLGRVLGLMGKKRAKRKFRLQTNDKLTGRFGTVGFDCSKCFRCKGDARVGFSLASLRAYLSREPSATQNALCKACNLFLKAAKESVNRNLEREDGDCRTVVHLVDAGRGCAMVRKLLPPLRTRPFVCTTPHAKACTSVRRCVVCRSARWLYRMRWRR